MSSKQWLLEVGNSVATEAVRQQCKRAVPAAIIADQRSFLASLLGGESPAVVVELLDAAPIPEPPAVQDWNPVEGA